MLRDGTTGDWIGTWIGHKGAVWSCRMDRTCSLTATASGDFSCIVWDAITGIALITLSHQHICKCVDFSPDSTRLATVGHEGKVRIFDLERILLQQGEPTADCVWEISPKTALTKVLWYSDNQTLLVGTNDGTIRILQVSGVQAIQEVVQHIAVGSEIRDMELTTLPSGVTMLTVAAGQTVYFYEFPSCKPLYQHKMPIHFREEGGASLHPDGTKFVAAGSDLWVRMFETVSGKELACWKGHHGPIRCLRFAPDGEQYATGSEDGTIRLWKTKPEQD